MKSILYVTLAWMIVLGAAAGGGAHHSSAPSYDMDASIEIQGVVKQWIFKNPHPYLHVEVTDPDGGVTEWEVEFAPATALAKRGWSAETFRPGEVVIVEGRPGRIPGTHGILQRRVNRADGRPVP